jgi:hypothetical protein
MAQQTSASVVIGPRANYEVLTSRPLESSKSAQFPATPRKIKK